MFDGQKLMKLFQCSLMVKQGPVKSESAGSIPATGAKKYSGVAQ